MSLQSLAHKANRHVAVGASGTGKTTCIEYDIRISKFDYLFIFDHQEELSDRLRIPEVTDFDEFENAIRSYKRICFNPRVQFSHCIPDCFSSFCDFVYGVSNLLEGIKLFVVDEIQRVSDIYKLPDGFKSILETSRRLQLDSILGAQSSNGLHNQIRQQTTHAFFYKSVDVNALSWPISLGIPEQELADLKEFEFIYCELRTGLWKKSKIIV